MILSGNAISAAVTDGAIRISPWDSRQLNPVSYDLRLGKKVGWYPSAELDSRVSHHFEVSEIDQSKGLLVVPNKLYLLHTEETIWTDRYVPIIDGKSSSARLGVAVHITAGFGDPGFDGQYTLEVVSFGHAVRLYAGMRIAQVRFHQLSGELTLYRGNYAARQARGPVPSYGWRQFYASPGNELDTSSKQLIGAVDERGKGRDA